MLAENIVHDHLASGCMLKGVRLEEGDAASGQTEQCQFRFNPAARRRWFNSLSDLRALCRNKDKDQLCGMYLQPIQGNYPAIHGLSFGLKRRQLVLRLIQVTTAKEHHPLELTTIQRLLLALGYKPLSAKNKFVVEILIMLKPTAFEKVLGAKALKHSGGSKFNIQPVVHILGLCECRLCINLAILCPAAELERARHLVVRFVSFSCGAERMSEEAIVICE